MMRVILMITMITRRSTVRILMMMMMVIKVIKLALTDNSAPLQWGLFCLKWRSVYIIARKRTVGYLSSALHHALHSVWWNRTVGYFSGVELFRPLYRKHCCDLEEEHTHF